jgi:hypothetical protein
LRNGKNSKKAEIETGKSKNARDNLDGGKGTNLDECAIVCQVMLNGNTDLGLEVDVQTLLGGTK